MTKNFVTGIGGFVASHLADTLIENGETVYGSYRWFEDTSRIKHLVGHSNFHMVPMDLVDQGSCLQAINEVQPDYVYHLAAQSFVSESFNYPLATMMANGCGTLNLLEAIRLSKQDPVVLVCSSSEVYGLVKKEDVPIKENQSFNPSNPYAVSKVAADMFGLMYFTNYGMKIIRTRFFTHTGPRRTMQSAECNFARQIALIEKEKQEPILRHGNLESIRTWADVRDAVKGYYILSRKGTYGDVYNIGGSTTKTIGETLNTLLSFSTMKDKIKLEQDQKLMRPYDVTLQIPDISKFKATTGWEPEISFEKTMCDLLNDWRERV